LGLKLILTLGQNGPVQICSWATKQGFRVSVDKAIIHTYVSLSLSLSLFKEERENNLGLLSMIVLVVLLLLL
jgi:hypothetical protein